MTLYQPFGCGCGGGTSLPNPECSNCFSVFGAGHNQCRMNSVFYTFPNNDCVRVIAAFNTFQCQGTCRYFEHAFTLWNVSNDACIYAVCSGKFKTCLDSGTQCVDQIPKHVNLLNWDEATCRGIWSMTFGKCGSDMCFWAQCGVGIAVSVTDFDNCSLCLLDGVRICGNGICVGQWGKGSNNICCNCIECKWSNVGDGFWPLESGHVAIKWNLGGQQGNTNCCSGVVIRKEDWTCSTFDICSAVPSNKRCCACFLLPNPGNIGVCCYEDHLCHMPKYCCVTSTQYCLLDTCGTCTNYRLFPHGDNTTSDGYCLSEKTYGEAFCWLDRPSSTCCICGTPSLTSSAI